MWLWHFATEIDALSKKIVDKNIVEIGWMVVKDGKGSFVSLEAC